METKISSDLPPGPKLAKNDDSDSLMDINTGDDSMSTKHAVGTGTVPRVGTRMVPPEIDASTFPLPADPPLCLSPALLEIKNSFLADLTYIQDELKTTNYDALIQPLAELLHLMGQNVDFTFRPEFPDADRLDACNCLKGKLDLFKSFVSCPKPEILELLINTVRSFLPSIFVENFSQIEAKFAILCKNTVTPNVNWSVPSTRKQNKIIVNTPILNTTLTPTISENLHSTNNGSSEPNNTDPSESMDDTTTQKDRIEPLFVKVEEDWKSFIAKIHALLSEPPFYKLQGDLVRLLAKNVEDFRKLQNFLVNNKYECAARTPLPDRPRKVVIKGLPPTTNTTDIIEELRLHGFSVTEIVNMRHRTTKVPMPLFLVDVAPNPKFEDILKIDNILFLKIKISIFTSKRARQCYRCQRFGHSSLTCHFNHRCVKCAGQHASKDCTKSKDTPAKCTNCSGPHTANYNGCPEHPNNRGKRQNPQQPSTTTKPTAPKQPNGNVNSVYTSPAPATTSTNPNPASVSIPTAAHIPQTDDFPALASTSNWGNSNPSRKKRKSSQITKTSQSQPDTSSTDKVNLPTNTTTPIPTTNPIDNFNASEAASMSSAAAEFFEVMREIRQLCSEFNMKDILNLLRATRAEMDKKTDPQDRFTVLFTSLYSFYAASTSPPPNNG